MKKQIENLEFTYKAVIQNNTVNVDIKFQDEKLTPLKYLQSLGIPEFNHISKDTYYQLFHQLSDRILEEKHLFQNLKGYNNFETIQELEKEIALTALCIYAKTEQEKKFTF